MFIAVFPLHRCQNLSPFPPVFLVSCLHKKTTLFSSLDIPGSSLRQSSFLSRPSAFMPSFNDVSASQEACFNGLSQNYILRIILSLSEIEKIVSSRHFILIIFNVSSVYISEKERQSSINFSKIITLFITS